MGNQYKARYLAKAIRKSDEEMIELLRLFQITCLKDILCGNVVANNE